MGMQDLWQRALLTGAGSPCEAGKDRDNPVSDGKPYAFRLVLRVVDDCSDPDSLASRAARSFSSIILGHLFGYSGVIFSTPLAWIVADIIVAAAYGKMIARGINGEFIRS